MPTLGEIRADGKIYTGPRYGWQSSATVSKRTPPKPGDERKVGGVPKVYTGPNYGWQTQATIDKKQGKTPPSTTPSDPSKTSAEPSTTATKASEAPTAKAKPEASKAPTPMQQWAKNFPKLAAKVKPGQSGYDEINNKKPTPVTPKPNLDDLRKAATQATMAGPSKEAQALMSDRTKNILGPEKLQAGIEGQKRVEKMKKAMESYDAYDIVLEYLFSEGHVDTISEAHYIMMQMSEDYIQDIVEGIMPEPIDPIKHKDAQKTQKIYNLGKGTNNPNESESALKRTGPQLPGV